MPSDRADLLRGRSRTCLDTPWRRCRDMPFRYRLINAADGRDLGAFVSRRDDWKSGDRLGRSKGEDMVVTALIEPEDDVDFRAYPVVVPAGKLGSLVER